MKRIMIPALAGSALVFAGAANAQQPDFSKVEMKTTDLGNRTYMLEGQGGNIVVACGQDAVIQVDTEFAPLHDKIKAAIDQACGGKPIKYISEDEMLDPQRRGDSWDVWKHEAMNG